MFATKMSAGIHHVQVSKHASEGIYPSFETWQMSPEVQIKGSGGSKKGNYCPPKYFVKVQNRVQQMKLLMFFITCKLFHDKLNCSHKY